MPTNRYGNTKVTKDGQSRDMRQRMARGRRARGEKGMTSAPSEGRKVTTNNTSNNVNSLRNCLLYTSPSPRDRQKSRMPSSA